MILHITVMCTEVYIVGHENKCVLIVITNCDKSIISHTFTDYLNRLHLEATMAIGYFDYTNMPYGLVKVIVEKSFFLQITI